MNPPSSGHNYRQKGRRYFFTNLGKCVNGGWFLTDANTKSPIVLTSASSSDLKYWCTGTSRGPIILLRVLCWGHLHAVRRNPLKSPSLQGRTGRQGFQQFRVFPYAPLIYALPLWTELLRTSYVPLKRASVIGILRVFVTLVSASASSPHEGLFILSPRCTRNNQIYPVRWGPATSSNQ